MQFEDETWAAVDMLARESRREFQELAEEAFRDLLVKHGRAIGLKEQLKRSLTEGDGNESAAAPANRPKKTKS